MSVKVKRFDLLEGRAEFVDDWVAVEEPVVLYVNGERVAKFLSLPSQLEELCVGWLLTQSLIDSVDEIESVEVKSGEVRIRCKRNICARLSKAGLVVDSAYGYEEGAHFRLDRAVAFVSSKYRVKAAEILSFLNVLNEKSRVFRVTGGTHSAAIFSNEELVSFAEDVGRHNAVDKAVGAAAIRGVDFSCSVLASTGRQPANMVLKAARVGIPIVASISAPLHSGIIAAEKAGVTLVCFVREKRMNVYTHHERIE
ncbi:MAG: formate dehydrogenase accessory sulfurtransferase FdhD [Candidatus Freyarchaeota archaeon]|nr:formate dehydrogenase accessory sulfurtransferase FdhD [Candidatus Jordarchaeia archaeon]